MIGEWFTRYGCPRVWTALARAYRWQTRQNLPSVAVRVVAGNGIKVTPGYHYIPRKDGTRRRIDHPGAYRAKGGGYAHYQGVIVEVGVDRLRTICPWLTDGEVPSTPTWVDVLERRQRLDPASE